ncbi:hypothetical protein C6Y44_26330 (plasmid) [Rhodococcus rhodochrous]|nr:hypothetical protein C6Y44_26330 [Rhodococcus rhodochrous]
MPTALALPDLTTGTWAIDPVHSTVEFSVRHLMVSKVRGTFNDFSGMITVPDAGEPSVDAPIAVASIDTRHADWDAHIASPDFFDAVQYPTAQFTSTALRPAGANLVLEGEFTLHGVTRPIALTLDFHGVNRPR